MNYNIEYAKDYTPEDSNKPKLLVASDAEGAYPLGTRVRKCNSEPEDSFPDGTAATVVGSLAVPGDLLYLAECDYFYFVEWDVLPGVPVGILGKRIEAL